MVEMDISKASMATGSRQDATSEWIQPHQTSPTPLQSDYFNNDFCSTFSSTGNSGKNIYDMAGAARARQGPRIKKEGKGDLYRIGGVDLPWDPELDLDKPKATPLFPVTIPPVPPL